MFLQVSEANMAHDKAMVKPRSGQDAARARMESNIEIETKSSISNSSKGRVCH
jgi:hypothetical protein